MLSTLRQTIPQLQLQLCMQSMIDVGDLVDAEMDAEDSEEEDEAAEFREVTESFQHFGHACVHALQNAYQRISGSRFLGKHIIWRGLSEVREAQMEFQFGMDEVWFKNTFRMNYEMFQIVVDQIRNDDVFRNNSRNPQAPVEYQLMVALAKFGHYGNAVGARSVARDFRVAEGTAVIWTRRVIIALLSIQDQWIQWPDESERQKIKTRIGRRSAFGGCTGFVDGTHLPIDIVPSYEGHSDFFNRKKRYSLNMMLVCDDEHRISYYSLGWGGAVHDARVFRNSTLATRPEQFFGDNEYILADSGYQGCASKTVISAYKERDSRSLVPLAQRQRFNQELSRQRVKVEHTIGMLKSRFQSLRGLRHIIKNQKTFANVLYHIRACMVLHNMMIGRSDDTFWDDVNMEVQEEEWEQEAEALRALMRGEDEAIAMAETEDDNMKEALRYHFQASDYRCPYTDDSGF